MGSQAFATMQRNQQAANALQQRQFAMRNPQAFAQMQIEKLKQQGRNAEAEEAQQRFDLHMEALKAEREQSQQRFDLQFGQQQQESGLQQKMFADQQANAEFTRQLELNPNWDEDQKREAWRQIQQQYGLIESQESGVGASPAGIKVPKKPSEYSGGDVALGTVAAGMGLGPMGYLAPLATPGGAKRAVNWWEKKVVPWWRGE